MSKNSGIHIIAEIDPDRLDSHPTHDGYCLVKEFAAHALVEVCFRNTPVGEESHLESRRIGFYFYEPHSHYHALHFGYNCHATRPRTKQAESRGILPLFFIKSETI